MKLKLLPLVIYFCSLTAPLNSQIYLMGVAPLKPGNLWKYVEIGGFGGNSTLYVTDSIITIGNNNYNVVEMFTDGASIRHTHYMRLNADNYYLKYDTLALDSNYKYYKKDCKIGDIWHQQYYIDLYEFSIIDTFRLNIWGKNFFSKVLKITDYSLVEVYQIWSDSIGLLEENSIGQYDMILRGCVINGVVYGDTNTYVGVEEELELPKEFLLIQNYPNPFNPITHINFGLPARTWVQLKVYDMLGNEIANLIDEEKEAGYYSVDFSATSGATNLPSGVYIYQLAVPGFTQARKMVLTK